MTPYIIIGVIALIVAIIAYSLKNEEKIVEKAEKSNSMFNFYHMLAVMTSSKYNNYKASDEEKQAMERFLSDNTVHDSHPIGGYFRLCKENNDVCATAGNFHNYDLAFNASDLLIGFAMFAFFVGLIILTSL
jgi:hypothetical protein